MIEEPPKKSTAMARGNSALHGWAVAVALCSITLCAGCSSPDSSGNTPPVANAGADITTALSEDGASVMLDGAQSYDPDGDDILFNWSLIEGPTQPDWSFEDRGLDYFEVVLRRPGLYVFELQVEDASGVMASDLVNVQVSPSLDAGPPDAEVPDAEVPDVEVPDVEVPDMEPEDMGLPDDMGPDAAPTNQAPQAVAEAEPQRLAVGQTVALSALGSTDDGLGGELSHRWRLISAPFGVQAQFDDPGDVAETSFSPLAPGRYTFEVQVADADFEDRTTVSFYVTGASAYALVPETRSVWPVDASTGLTTNPPVQWGGGGEPLMLAARAGVLYVITAPTEVSPGTLLVLAPGRPEVRRALPRNAIVTGLYPTVTGVWIVLSNSPLMWFTDPLGSLSLQPVAVPENYPNGGGFAAEGNGAWMSSTFSDAAVLRLDAITRSFETVAVDTANRCNPRDLAVDDTWLYLACRNQGAVARVPRDFEGALEWSSAITAGNLGQRAEQMVLVDDVVVVRHNNGDRLSLIPIERFDLPEDDPERFPGALPSVMLSGTPIDIFTGDGQAHVLVRRPDGSTGLDVFEPGSPETLRALSLTPTGVTDLVIDAAEDPNFALDPL
ncbi:MAG: PKD domain-containing protein [Bradymonadia bacterium]